MPILLQLSVLKVAEKTSQILKGHLVRWSNERFFLRCKNQNFSIKFFATNSNCSNFIQYHSNEIIHLR